METVIADLVRSGRIADIAIACVVAEGLVRLALRLRSRTITGLGRDLAHLTAGGSILVALKSALVGASWGWVAGPLAFAMVAHVADIAMSHIQARN